MYRLISATPSPYARKVRAALAEKGIPFELQTEVPWNSATQTPAYNPLEKVPVLVLPDGRGVYESRFILEWLEAKHPEPPLLPADTDGVLAARQVEVIADGICDALVLLFWERHREEEHRSAPWMARQRRTVDGGLRALSAMRKRGTAGAAGSWAGASAWPTSRRARCSATSTSASPNTLGGTRTPPWPGWPTAWPSAPPSATRRRRRKASPMAWCEPRRGPPDRRNRRRTARAPHRKGT